jgi:hypothetical protein
MTEPTTPAHSQLAHETTDVNVPRLFVLGAGLAVTIVLACLTALWTFSYFSARERQRQPEFPLAAQDNSRPLRDRIDSVPPPQLEGLSSPGATVQQRSTYAWVEGERGRVARIPIEAAMREVLRQPEFLHAGQNYGGGR